MYTMRRMKLISVVTLLVPGVADGSAAGGPPAAQSQTPAGAQGTSGVAPGKYVCYDLTLVLGSGGYRYGYKYMESFTIVGGGGYRREATGSRGEYRFDPKTRAITFRSGPYAEAGRVGKYEPQGKRAAERPKESAAGEGGTPNIILRKKGDKSGDSDWYCSLERR